RSKGAPKSGRPPELSAAYPQRRTPHFSVHSTVCCARIHNPHPFSVSLPIYRSPTRFHRNRRTKHFALRTKPLCLTYEGPLKPILDTKASINQRGFGHVV